MSDYENEDFEYNFTWNHRVLKTTSEFEGMIDEEFRIVEAQYRDGELSSYCEPFLQGDTLEDLSAVLDQMKTALAKPVLLIEDFPNYEEEDDNA